jgi:hypothetical protein
VTPAGDPGPGYVAELRDALMVDPEWRVESDRAFTWWPHRVAQRISAGEPLEDDGVRGCRVHVETDVLEVEEPSAHLDGLLAELMRHPPMSGFRYDAARRKARLWSSLFVHEALAAFFLPRLAVAALLQATYAELGKEALTKLTGLPPAESAHPTSGARTAPDDLLHLARERVLPAGEGSSRWSDAGELLRAAEGLAARGAKSVAAPLGLNARFPFVAGAAEPLAPGASSLLQVRHGEPHPELGYGVFLRLFLPGPPTLSKGVPLPTLALRLNDLERRDPSFTGASLGSWCLEQSEPETELPVQAAPARLCHVTFLPNYVRVEGALENAVLDAGRRALWAAHVFAHGSGVA